MSPRCEDCGCPAWTARPGHLLCAGCRERDEQWQKRRDDADRSGRPWNTSRDDPWWKEWLTSGELFSAYHDTAPRVGAVIGGVLGGVIYECGRGSGLWVQAWVAPGEVVVAYPTMWDRFGSHVEEEGPHEVEVWIHHLRSSDPLELGQVRGRSSYGALRPGAAGARPLVKWAQCGDWAGLARRWHNGPRPSDE